MRLKLAVESQNISPLAIVYNLKVIIINNVLFHNAFFQILKSIISQGCISEMKINESQINTMIKACLLLLSTANEQFELIFLIILPIIVSVIFMRYNLAHNRKLITEFVHEIYSHQNNFVMNFYTKNMLQCNVELDVGASLVLFFIHSIF